MLHLKNVFLFWYMPKITLLLINLCMFSWDQGLYYEAGLAG